MKLYQGKYPISDAAEYVIDYVYDNPSGENFYYQLVRISDNAILASAKEQNTLFIHCWKHGIPYEKVSII